MVIETNKNEQPILRYVPADDAVGWIVLSDALFENRQFEEAGRYLQRARDALGEIPEREFQGDWIYAARQHNERIERFAGRGASLRSIEIPRIYTDEEIQEAVLSFVASGQKLVA